MQTAALHAMHVSQITLHQTWSKTYWDMSISWDFFPRKLHGPVYTKSCLNGISCRHGYLLHPHGRAKDTSRHFFSNASSHIPWVGCLKPLANLDQYGSTWINIHTILYYVLHALTCALFGWHPIRQPLTQLSDELTKFFQSFWSPWHAMANLSEHLRRDLAGNSPGLHKASKA